MNPTEPFSLEPPRGMRDFYPEEMAWRERVFDAFRRAAALYGFEPYDACVVERLEILQRKSGEEVAAQIYAFEDKSGRRLALRPEMTPTLARMVAARQGRLAFPIKWSAIAQCFRYERMTRGRKREHYQWNLDIVGEESVAAEAEILATAVAALRGMGVPDGAYRVRVSSRALLGELLLAFGIPAAHHAAVFLALDKRGKIADEDLLALLQGEGLDGTACETVLRLLEIRSLEDAARQVGADSPALASLRELFALLDAYGLREQVVFDIAVIRGLSYYTGIVFEAFDTQGKFRALFGGGRYDGLLSALGGRPSTAVGLGFGDVVVGELIRDLSGGDDVAPRVGILVGYMTPVDREAATRLAARLRAEGQTAALQLRPQKPKAFFGQAAASRAAEAIFVGPDDRARGCVRAKHLDTRTERELAL